jgi:hypothetical protein
MRHPARWIVGVVAGVTLQACSSKAPPPEQAGEANTVKDVAAINAVQDREVAMVATSSGDSLITIVTSDGYVATLQDAQVDITKGNIVSQKPVEVHSSDGWLHVV